MAKKKKKVPAVEPSGAPERISRPFAEALAPLKASMKEAEAKPAATRTKPRPLRGAAGLAGLAGLPDRATSPEVARLADRRAYEDRVALGQAYEGVKPIARAGAGERWPSRASVRVGEREAHPETPIAEHAAALEAAARERLGALVSGWVAFDVTREDDGWVSGRMRGASLAQSEVLRGGRATPEAELDLHGMTADEARRALKKFVRAEHRRGTRVARVIHGKGLHSDGGTGVLADAVVETLTAGEAAPFVVAFETAASRNGGTGAVLVALRDR